MLKKIAVRHNPKTQRVDIIQVICLELSDKTYEGTRLVIDGPSHVCTGIDPDLNVTCWIETHAPLALTQAPGENVVIPGC